MRFLNFPRLAAACLGGALALAYASAAGAMSISNLTVTLGGTNTPNLFDDAGPVGAEIGSTVGVTSSAAMQFITRYQAGVYTDAGGNGAATNITTLNASYTISFDVINAVGSNWQLDIDTRRRGARTAVTDGGGDSAFGLSAVTGLVGGAGTLTTGSLGLVAIANSQQTNTVNIAFDQTGNALINGSGNGTITLTFGFTATAQTIVAGNGNNAAGDEAAIRMGIPATISSFSAGNYPGPDARTAANDGHFVDALLIDLGPIPEPGTAAMLGLGLVMLGAWRRNQRRAR